LSDGQKKKYIEMFGSFTEPFNCKKTTMFCKMLLDKNQLNQVEE